MYNVHPYPRHILGQKARIIHGEMQHGIGLVRGSLSIPGSLVISAKSPLACKVTSSHVVGVRAWLCPPTPMGPIVLPRYQPLFCCPCAIHRAQGGHDCHHTSPSAAPTTRTRGPALPRTCVGETSTAVCSDPASF